MFHSNKAHLFLSKKVDLKGNVAAQFMTHLDNSLTVSPKSTTPSPSTMLSEEELKNRMNVQAALQRGMAYYLTGESPTPYRMTDSTLAQTYKKNNP